MSTTASSSSAPVRSASRLRLRSAAAVFRRCCSRPSTSSSRSCAATFHPPTLDLLDEFEIVPRMIEVGLKAPTWQFRDRETGPVATFDLSLLAGDTNHPY